MIKVIEFESEYPASPHAILFRPLRYFTVAFRASEDGLDEYQGASFAIGNHIRFALRTYRGHAKFTVTLYLSDELDDNQEILETIDRILQEMAVPASSVAWRRGEPIKWGQVERRPDDRLRESEARILVLKIAAQRPHRTATTQFIKDEIPKYTELSPIDLARSPSRPREQIWRQIVGNVFSHKESTAGPFAQGYAERTEDGLTVTRKGIIYLSNMGYVV